MTEGVSHGGAPGLLRMEKMACRAMLWTAANGAGEAAVKPPSSTRILPQGPQSRPCRPLQHGPGAAPRPAAARANAPDAARDVPTAVNQSSSRKIAVPRDPSGLIQARYMPVVLNGIAMLPSRSSAIAPPSPPFAGTILLTTSSAA